MQSNQPHTFVVVTLDPPIRKGQTLYPHIVLQVLLVKFHWKALFYTFLIIMWTWADLCCIPTIFVQFETDYVVESTLSMNEDLLNTKYKDKLEPTYKVW